MILHNMTKLFLAILLFVCLGGQSQAQEDEDTNDYILAAKHSGNLLTVSNEGKDNGTTVWQYEANGNDAQKWKIESLGDGYYKLIAKHSGKVLAVDGGNGATQNMVNVQQWDWTGTDNQKWKITAGNVEAQSQAQFDPNIYYTLTAKHSGKLLDVCSGDRDNGANVWQYEANGTDAQKWKIESLGDGYYKLTAKHSGKVLDVDGGTGATQNGANVQQWDWIGDNQKWKMESLGDGYYKLTAKHSGKVLAVNGGNEATQNGVNVQQWDWTGTDNQKWKIESLGDGYYKLTAKHSGKILAVNGGNEATQNGVNVQQWDWTGTDNQKWKIMIMTILPTKPIINRETAEKDKIFNAYTTMQAQNFDSVKK